MCYGDDEETTLAAMFHDSTVVSCQEYWFYIEDYHEYVWNYFHASGDLYVMVLCASWYTHHKSDENNGDATWNPTLDTIYPNIVDYELSINFYAEEVNNQNRKTIKVVS
jgi:hypothetical protein